MRGRPSAPSARALRLALPLSGVHGKHWVISYYVDQNYVGPAPPSGVRDYRGGPRSYPNHGGTDFLVPNFRFMDDNRVKIRAAAAGEVIFAEDGSFDRVVADEVEEVLNDPRYENKCNRVVIRHANNYQTSYRHMKKGSVLVKAGDRVAAGAPLGIIGSSGCSTAPHLDFEVRDDTNRVVDPFKRALWYAPPTYETPLGLLDYYCVLCPDTDFNGKDPPLNNLTRVPVDSCIQFAVYVAGIKAGHMLRITFTRPDGKTDDISEKIPLERNEYWCCSASDISLSFTGEWIFNAYADDTDLRVNHTLMVE